MEVSFIWEPHHTAVGSLHKTSDMHICLLCGRSPNRIPASYLCYMHVGNTTGCHAIKRSAGVVPEVNLRHLLCAGEEAHMQGIHPGFETQGRHHQKSITRVSVAPQKGLMSSKNFIKKERHLICAVNVETNTNTNTFADEFQNVCITNKRSNT